MDTLAVEGDEVVAAVGPIGGPMDVLVEVKGGNEPLELGGTATGFKAEGIVGLILLELISRLRLDLEIRYL